MHVLEDSILSRCQFSAESMKSQSKLQHFLDTNKLYYILNYIWKRKKEQLTQP